MTASLPHGCVERCPGCRFRALSPDDSDKRKQEWARRNLEPLGIQPKQILSPKDRWGYRRKVQLHAACVANSWEFGLLKRRGRETELIAIPECPLHSNFVNKVLWDLRTLIPVEAPLVFALFSGPLLTLVLKCAPSEKWKAWAGSLEAALLSQGVRGLFINWNPSAGRRAVSSRHQEKIFGADFVEEDGIAFGPLSFRQQIPEVEGAAVAKASEFLSGSKFETVADLYSGVGGTLQIWEQKGWKAVGVELGGEACRAAERNAPRSKVLKGKVEQRIPQLLPLKDNFVVYTNPPREGHHPEVIDWLLEARPERIAYLSCNQRTLARDLSALQASYTVCEVQPFDFFPQTDHVEALALLEKR